MACVTQQYRPRTERPHPGQSSSTTRKKKGNTDGDRDLSMRFSGAEKSTRYSHSTQLNTNHTPNTHPHYTIILLYPLHIRWTASLGANQKKKPFFFSFLPPPDFSFIFSFKAPREEDKEEKKKLSFSFSSFFCSFSLVLKPREGGKKKVFFLHFPGNFW